MQYWVHYSYWKYIFIVIECIFNASLTYPTDVVRTFLPAADFYDSIWNSHAVWYLTQYGSLVTPVPCLCGVRMMILVILLALYDLRSHKFRHQITRRPYGKARGARTNMSPPLRVYDKKNASYNFNSALKATYMPYYMLKTV